MTIRENKYTDTELLHQRIAHLETTLAQTRRELEQTKHQNEQNHQDKKALLASEKRFRMLVEHIADPVIVVDGGIIHFANPAAETMFGRSLEELIGSEIGIPVVASDKAEVDIFSSQGARYIAEMRVVQIEWEGKPASLATFRDITARKQFEKELERRVDERTALLRHMMQQLSTELEEREKAEKTILRRDVILEAIEFAAHRFLKSTSVSQEIPTVLEYFGKATLVHRVTLFTLHNEVLTHTFNHTMAHERCNAASEFENTPGPRNFTRWKEQLRRGFSIHGDVRTFPPIERQVLEQEGIQSLVVVPIFVEHKWWGCIEFDEHNVKRVWSLAEVEALRAAASMIGTARQHEIVLEALRQSEERFRTVADYTFNWEYWIDPSGRFVYMSPSCEQITGFHPDEFQANPMLLETIIHPGDRHTVLALLHNETETTTQSFEITFRIITRDGEQRWISSANKRVSGANGEWLGWRCSNRDITDFTAMEEALRQSEEKFRNIIEYTSDGINLADEEGILIEWNRGAEHITGLKREDVIGKLYWDVLFDLLPDTYKSGEAYDQCKLTVQKFFQTGQASWLNQITEQQFQHGDGTILYAQQLCFPITTSKGVMAGAIFRDVTERKRAEERLRLSEEQYRMFVEGTDDLIVQVDQDAILLYANHTAERIFGVSAEACPGKSLFDFVHPNDRKRTNIAFAGWIQRQATNVTFEIRHLSRTGSVYHMHWVFSLYYNDSGKLTMMNGIARNISERKHIEDALRESETRYRFISELVSDFAYALRIDIDGHLILEWATDALVRTTGYTVEQIRDNGGWESLIDPEDMSIYRQHYDCLMDGQASDVCEFRIVTRQGETRFVRNHSRPVWDKSLGRLAFLYGAAQDITERKHTEEALRESEQKFRSIIEQSSDGINLADEEGILIEWNRGAEEITGIPRDEALGHMYWDILYRLFPDSLKTPQAYEQCKLSIQVFFETGTAPWINRVAELKFQHASGYPLYAQQLCFPITTHKGVMACAIFRNITDRVNAEQALRQSEERYRLVSELISDFAFAITVNADGTLTYDWVTDAFERITNCTFEEVGTNGGWLHLIHPDDTETYIQCLQQLIAGQRNVCQYRLCARDGTIRWMRSYAYPVWDEKLDRVVRIYGAAQDITNTVQMEDAYHTLVDHSLQGLIIVQDQRIVFANPMMATITGYGIDTLINQSFDDLCNFIVADDLLLFKENIQRCMQGECPIIQNDIRMIRSDGIERWLEIAVTRIRYRDELAVQGACIDITERKQIDKALQEANDRLEQRVQERTSELSKLNQALQKEIIERQRIADNLRLFKTIVETSQEAIAISDPDGQLVYINPAHEKLFGRSLEEARNLNYRDYYPPESITMLNEEVVPALYHGKGWQGELYVYDASGRLFPLWERADSIRDTDGNMLFGFGMMHDVSESKRAEERIRQHAARTEALAHVAARLNAQLDVRAVMRHVCDETVQALNVSMIVFRRYEKDTDSFVVAEHIGIPDSLLAQFCPLGYTTYNTMVCKTSHIHIHTLADLQSEPQNIPRTILDTLHIQEMACTTVMQNDKPVALLQVLNTDATRVFTDDELILLQGIADQAALALTNALLFEEVTQERQHLAQRVDERTIELRQANEQLAHALRTKDEFLANMSHELRTPLNATLGLTESLLESVYGEVNGKQIRALQTIYTSGSHLLELINDILDLAKIEADKVTITLENVGIHSVCQSSLQFVKQSAQKKRIHLLFTCDPEPSTISADGRRLKQILVNLLSNAVKFTPSGGSVGLEVKPDIYHESLHFIVWDTGIGIAPEHIERLFKPFEQLDSSLSREYVGTGLGLALVARMAELHGGSVSVESEIGKGSRFTVSLPLQIDVVAQTSDEAVYQYAPELSSSVELETQEVAISETAAHFAASSTILLVEDNRSNVDMYCEFLTSKGYQVNVAWNGEEALTRFQKKPPALILMDIQMPRMDGLEATRRIRMMDEGATVPIIALTALAMPGDRERCLDAGVTEYVRKPISLRRLLHLVKTYLV